MKNIDREFISKTTPVSELHYNDGKRFGVTGSLRSNAKNNIRNHVAAELADMRGELVSVRDDWSMMETADDWGQLDHAVLLAGYRNGTLVDDDDDRFCYFCDAYPCMCGLEQEPAVNLYPADDWYQTL